MTKHMAEEITGDSSASDILNEVNRKNYFISRHGQADPVYEYHPLYQDFLQAQAKKLLLPADLRELRGKSATLLELNGQTEAAVFQLKEIGEWKAMADIVLTHAPGMLNEGRHRLLQEWLEFMHPDAAQAIPWLIYFRAMSIMPFNPATAQELFEEAFDKFQKQQDQFGAMLSASGAINAIFWGYENFAPLDHWRAGLNELAQDMDSFPDQQIEAWVTGCLVIASSLREVYSPETEVWEKRVFTIVETSATASIKAQALYLVYWHQLFYKGIPDALPVLNELQRMASAYETQPLVSACALLAEAQYHLCTGLHDKVMAAAIKGLDIAEKTGVHSADVWYYFFLIMSYNNRMDYAGTDPWIDKIQKDVNTWPKWSKSSYHWIMTQREIFRKDYTRALYEGELGLDLAIKSGNPFSIASNHLSLANLFHIIGKRHEALEHLEQGRSYALQRNSKVTMIIVLLHDAKFAFDDGDEAKGLSLLGQSLALARESEVAIHLSYNPMLALSMCEKALEEGIEVEFVQHIIRRRQLIPQKSPVHIEHWPWPVKIYTMGRFTILIDDEHSPPQRKTKQTPIKLLQALIALGGRDVSCEKLSDLLWPDAEGDTAHHALETTLHRLRGLLGYPDAIRLANGKLTLDNRYCWVDTWAFERLLGQADNCIAGANEESRKKDLIEKATSL